MKTPLQQLIETMNEYKEHGCLFQLRNVKNVVEELLLEERKQIEDAFLHGKRDGLLNVHQKPESFFNSRYNQ
jgi:hypothetical protein